MILDPPFNLIVGWLTLSKLPTAGNASSNVQYAWQGTSVAFGTLGLGTICKKSYFEHGLKSPLPVGWNNEGLLNKTHW